MTTTVFLDVDGVINCIGMPPGRYLIPMSPWRSADVLGFPINWSEPVVEWINSIHRRGLARVVWLTTWRAMARDNLAPIVGLDRFDVIDASERELADGSPVGRPLEWWKMRHVLDALPQGDVVWLDDDIRPPHRKVGRELAQINHTRSCRSPRCSGQG